MDEIDLDTYQRPTTIDEMTAEDWERARDTLRAFDAGQR